MGSRLRPQALNVSEEGELGKLRDRFEESPEFKRVDAGALCVEISCALNSLKTLNPQA